ncbi:MAG: DNA replication and repair protein RecF [Candidatus Curtissbacteria bacterium]|nr:DNA replication and repair protein RecF [Candidatus Curtissbacteria bacterium]
MEILSLDLTNFRNFSAQKIAFSKNLTVIIGANGSGKSNILEAVSLLSGIKSSRVETDLDLIKFGKTEAKIEGTLDVSKLTINFQVVDETLRGSPQDSGQAGQAFVRKAYFVDSIKKRLLDFVDHFSIIEFSPFDLDLVVGSPSLRRHHLDILLSGLDRDYWRAISSYNKVVVRRNKVLLRILEHQAKPSELDFWDERLIEHGVIVSRVRQDFFEYLNFVEKKDYSWELKQSLVTAEKLAKNRERDISAGVTLSGPHRDDFQFLFRERNLEYFGSRGEQRMAVLALKLAELEYFAFKKGVRPVLALDDIFSELDWEHREAVLSVIGKQQTIITAAEPESLPKEIFKKAKVVELR